MITLNLQEREYFASYLDQEANADQALVDQMVAVGSNEAIVKRYRLMVVARQVVAKDLRRVEIQEVG